MDQVSVSNMRDACDHSVRGAEGRRATMLLMENPSDTPHANDRRERTHRELRDERNRQLAAGNLELAAELTTWIDEMIAESCGQSLRHRSA